MQFSQRASAEGRLKRFLHVCCAVQTPLYLSNGQPLAQVLDLSRNNFSGSLPSFLQKAAVPSWTANGIYLQVSNCHKYQFQDYILAALRSVPADRRTGDSISPCLFQSFLVIRWVWRSSSISTKKNSQHQKHKTCSVNNDDAPVEFEFFREKAWGSAAFSGCWWVAESHMLVCWASFGAGQQFYSQLQWQQLLLSDQHLSPRQPHAVTTSSRNNLNCNCCATANNITKYASVLLP